MHKPENKQQKQQTLPWHDRPLDAVLLALQAGVSGLENEEARARLQAYGPNELKTESRSPAWLRFLLQFHNILIHVLIASAVITAVLQHWVDTLVIGSVVVVNAVIGFIQEGKAEKAMDAIRLMLAPHAAVIRGGERHKVEAHTLVPGDLVLLEAGDRVPADLRLLQAHGLVVQEAVLTGESVPVEKQIQPVATNAPLGDRSCMVFSGTLVVSGQGRGVVVATGTATEIGRISGLLSAVQVLTTPLVQQMTLFARWLTFLILLIAGLLLLYGHFVMHYEFTELFMVVVGLSVSAIPEGLPAVLTITLAIGVQKMALRNAIVRRLPAIETIGSVSVICTDKTGTLTRNEMMVASLLSPQHLFSIDGNGYKPDGVLRLQETETSAAEHAVLTEMARACTLCNDAVLKQHDGIWTVEGDPMEGALLALSGKIGLDTRREQADWTRTDTIPFDARHRFMATLHHDHDNHGLILVKGAPEQVLAMCKSQRAPGTGTETLDHTFWQQSIDRIAAQGQRVLAFAQREVEPAHTVLEFTDVQGSLTLLGMVGMIDPPRPDAISAVTDCHKAGIRVKMITGDHAKTAVAIARQIGLENSANVLTGTDLDAMNDAELKAAVVDCDIFARTSPEHKLRLVMALQSHDIALAMTGDGVNDAPALKRADVGIAMGCKGSEAAKEAAELILADDNFASIAAAVREGRTVYDNIKKVISWTLPTNAGEVMTIIVALLLGMTLPVTPVQILWVNLITASTLGLTLAFEPTEKLSMQRPPRARNEALLGGELVWHILLVSMLFLAGVYGIFSYAIERQYSLELARTIVVNTLVVMEIFHLFFIRNIYTTSLNWQAVKGTRAVWLAIAVITVAQFSITYVPALQKIFATEAVPLADGLLIISAGIMLFVIIEIEKQLRLRLRRKS